jgi:RNA polymerase sigma-70 factor (ECF subfamily)
MPTVTDQELMSRVRDGEVSQLGELFERHHRRLYNFLLRMVGNRQVAEDLVQETFMRMLRYRQTFRGEGEFTAWMFSMARNLGATYFRQNLRAPQVSVEDAPEPATESTQADELEQADEAHLVQRALMQLPPDKRELLLLSRYEMLKHRQIADLLGCSVGAVKVRIHRAMRQLRETYNEMASEAST